MSDIDARKALWLIMGGLATLLGWIAVEWNEELKDLGNRMTAAESEIRALREQTQEQKEFRDKVVGMMIQNKERALIP